MKLAVVGTGLLGGAVARAARARGVASTIIGIEPDDNHANLAVEHGVIDERVHEVPADADLIVLCCPSDRVAEWVVTLGNGTVPVCDVGSVKAPIVRELKALLGGELPACFVPSHPIAGSEKTGPLHAPVDLFSDRPVVIVPHAQLDGAARTAVERFWAALGGDVIAMDAEAHDRVLAVTSHLPHYLAYAFMLQVEEADLSLSGGGFSDFTRIAAANPDMWWRIFKMNRDALMTALDGFEANLADLRRALEAGDDGQGMALLQRAARRRNQL